MNSKNKVKFDLEIKKIQPFLYSYIFSLCPHKQDAEDILQKTNLILCKKQDEIDEFKSFKAWAFKIAKFQVMGHRTSHARSKICFSNELTEQLADQSIDCHELSLKKQALNECYKKLPPHMSMIAELRYKKNLSLKEISSTTARPIGSVSATMFRIRESLSKCIHEEYRKVKESEFFKVV